ncbi:MAG: enoyl-CoA hydratase/isomerase family protein [Chloroflexota bacterium]|nr:MAG: enoyl-CoA hydratase/isomerase family protein [Chloroflexota bacterium]
MSNPVDYKVDRGVAVLMIDRPESMNALNWSAQVQFSAAVENAAVDPSLRVLIITASGDKAFVAGGDLKELADHPSEADAERLNRVMGAALDKLTQLPLPVICAVNGDAIGGGCEIVTACDLRLAAEHVRFRFAQVHLGLTTGWGGAARLVHLLGASQAMELLLTGRAIDAKEALKMGLVHRSVKRGEVQTEALSWAEELRALPREALAALKRQIWQAANLSLPALYQLEKESFVGLWPSADHLEAMAAFKGKRRPGFGERR